MPILLVINWTKNDIVFHSTIYYNSINNIANIHILFLAMAYIKRNKSFSSKTNKNKDDINNNKYRIILCLMQRMEAGYKKDFEDLCKITI